MTEDDDDLPEGGSGEGGRPTMTIHIGGRDIEVPVEPSIAQRVAEAVSDFSANVLGGEPEGPAIGLPGMSKPIETEAPETPPSGPVLKHDDEPPVHIAWDDIAERASEGNFAPSDSDDERLEAATRAEASRQDHLVRAEANRQHLEELSGAI